MAKQNHCSECGALQEKPTSRRSTPQLRRFMAIVKAAYHNWPDTADFRPQNWEHLRYYLEMRAGHYTVIKTARIESTDPDKLYQFMRAFMQPSKDTTLFIALDGNLLIEKRTKSIDYERMGDSADFSRLKDDVCEIIEQETGLSADRLLRETERAA